MCDFPHKARAHSIFPLVDEYNKETKSAARLRKTSEQDTMLTFHLFVRGFTYCQIDYAISVNTKQTFSMYFSKPQVPLAKKMVFDVLVKAPSIKHITFEKQELKLVTFDLSDLLTN